MPASYRDAIVSLSDDPELYARKQDACAGLRARLVPMTTMAGIPR